MSGAIVSHEHVLGRAMVTDAADVVIVGSGAAGATAARVLVEAGLDVIVIEEGPHVAREQLRSDMFTSFRRLWRDMGFQVARGRAITPVLQGACVGGTTVINGAIIHRMPEAVFEQWRREHGVGGVLDFAALERVYDTLDRELSVAPAPDAVLGEQNAAMERALSRLGIAGNRIRRNVRDCDGSAHCNQGCPNGRKQSMDNTYLPRAIAAGARVYATCEARELVQQGGRVCAVRGAFRSAAGAEVRLTAHARHAVILAASAIQSPLLLLDNRLGNRRVVGRRFQAHPGTAVMGVFDRPIQQWFGATQGYETTQFWNERMKFETVGMPPELGAVRLPGFGRKLTAQLANYGSMAVFGVQIRARTHGRVRRTLLGRKAIEFDLNAEDVRTLKLGVRRLSELMFAAGARAISPGVAGLPDLIDSMDGLAGLDALPDDPRLFHCIASHLFGTAAMGDAPQHSVVRPDFRLHDVPGLYVTDSSVFPTNLGVNPQHTVCALSWLAAEHIAELTHKQKAAA